MQIQLTLIRGTLYDFRMKKPSFAECLSQNNLMHQQPTPCVGLNPLLCYLYFIMLIQFQLCGFLTKMTSPIKGIVCVFVAVTMSHCRSQSYWTRDRQRVFVSVKQSSV